MSMGKLETSRDAMRFSSVVFPTPLLPTTAYLRPAAQRLGMYTGEYARAESLKEIQHHGTPVARRTPVVAQELEVGRLEELLPRVREDDPAAIHQKVLVVAVIVALVGAVGVEDVVAHRRCARAAASENRELQCRGGAHGSGTEHVVGVARTDLLVVVDRVFQNRRDGSLQLARATALL
jgi:hypothetical protein